VTRRRRKAAVVAAAATPGDRDRQPPLPTRQRIHPESAIVEVKVPQLSDRWRTTLQWKKLVRCHDEILIEIETDKVVLEVRRRRRCVARSSGRWGTVVSMKSSPRSTRKGQPLQLLGGAPRRPREGRRHPQPAPSRCPLQRS
jgi:hypothetical protein